MKEIESGIEFEEHEFLRLREIRITAENEAYLKRLKNFNDGLIPKIDNSKIDLDENREEIERSKEKFKNQQRITNEYNYLNGTI